MPLVVVYLAFLFFSIVAIDKDWQEERRECRRSLSIRLIFIFRYSRDWQEERRERRRSLSILFCFGTRVAWYVLPAAAVSREYRADFVSVCASTCFSRQHEETAHTAPAPVSET